MAHRVIEPLTYCVRCAYLAQSWKWMVLPVRSFHVATIISHSVQPNSMGYALLAHSVEHFHGKEEVVGSIPTEGSECKAA